MSNTLPSHFLIPIHIGFASTSLFHEAKQTALTPGPARSDNLTYAGEIEVTIDRSTPY
jgi:hypothetical protein